eukprot:TRINITY_DN8467_c0_g1_i1.p1 TRINITY_DN8467_c0_g1~~TRINITY_DN8467_c0_g1_i1.p1  ORF type:complete len:996 (+),score=99.66 TRINITY_DN8467_c0_g1_i1:449-2989(+)
MLTTTPGDTMSSKEQRPMFRFRPLDVVDIGFGRIRRPGEVYTVKPLASFCIQRTGNDSEYWVIVAIDFEDPMAAALEDGEDMEAILPGMMKLVQAWLLKEHQAAYNQKAVCQVLNSSLSLSVATAKIARCHLSWSTRFERLKSGSNTPTCPWGPEEYVKRLSSDFSHLQLQHLPPSSRIPISCPRTEESILFDGTWLVAGGGSRSEPASEDEGSGTAKRHHKSLRRSWARSFSDASDGGRLERRLESAAGTRRTALAMKIRGRSGTLEPMNLEEGTSAGLRDGEEGVRRGQGSGQRRSRSGVLQAIGSSPWGRGRGGSSEMRPVDSNVFAETPRGGVPAGGCFGQPGMPVGTTGGPAESTLPAGSGGDERTGGTGGEGSAEDTRDAPVVAAESASRLGKSEGENAATRRNSGKEQETGTTRPRWWMHRGGSGALQPSNQLPAPQLYAASPPTDAMTSGRERDDNHAGRHSPLTIFRRPRSQSSVMEPVDWSSGVQQPQSSFATSASASISPSPPHAASTRRSSYREMWRRKAEKKTGSEKEGTSATDVPPQSEGEAVVSQGREGLGTRRSSSPFITASMPNLAPEVVAAAAAGERESGAGAGAEGAATGGAGARAVEGADAVAALPDSNRRGRSPLRSCYGAPSATASEEEAPHRRRRSRSCVMQPMTTSTDAMEQLGIGMDTSTTAQSSARRSPSPLQASRSRASPSVAGPEPDPRTGRRRSNSFVIEAITWRNNAPRSPVDGANILDDSATRQARRSGTLKDSPPKAESNIDSSEGLTRTRRSQSCVMEPVTWNITGDSPMGEHLPSSSATPGRKSFGRQNRKESGESSNTKHGQAVDAVSMRC